jgi:hypothetical protein
MRVGVPIVVIMVVFMRVPVVVIMRVPVMVVMVVIVSRGLVVMVVSRGPAAEGADEHGDAHGGDQDSAGDA